MLRYGSLRVKDSSGLLQFPPVAFLTGRYHWHKERTTWKDFQKLGSLRSFA